MKKKKIKKESNEKLHWFERFSSKAIKVTGSSGAFITACILIIVWIVTGPVFHYSDVWQLAINTGTTIITFLMVFLIQKTQNKDALAIQVKLNELVAANQTASNRIISVEDLSEEELEHLNAHYTRLAEITKRENNPKTSRSIEDSVLAEEKKQIEKKIDNIRK
ncbi:MAG: low affinity iron permease family protein [Bacteroidia bacterium]